MNFRTNHITVCICTYRRTALLRRALESLIIQEAANSFSVSVVVADNDSGESARETVGEIAATAPFPIVYCVEREQNIALVRNKALEMADGEFAAFIDDDEFAVSDWLLRLHSLCLQHQADGVLGPVRPHFAEQPPAWILKGGLCERPEHPTGTVLQWWQARTGNVLFRRQILEDVEQPFRPEFGTGGEDQDFFHRMMDRGSKFIWCNEAIAYETVPPSRWRRSYMWKRALLRGRNSLKHTKGRLLNIVKSLVAVPFYSISLPVMFLAGPHWFMKTSIRLCDHLGRILTLLHINPVQQREI